MKVPQLVSTTAVSLRPAHRLLRRLEADASSAAALRPARSRSALAVASCSSANRRRRRRCGATIRIARRRSADRDRRAKTARMRSSAGRPPLAPSHRRRQASTTVAAPWPGRCRGPIALLRRRLGWTRTARRPARRSRPPRTSAGARAGARHRVRQPARARFPGPRVPPGAGPRRRHLRGDDPRARRQGRPRPRGPDRLQGRRRRAPSPTPTILRPRRPAQHAAFFDEIARVLRPGGHVIVAASWGRRRRSTRARLLRAGLRAARDRAGRSGGRRRDLLGRPPARRPCGRRAPTRLRARWTSRACRWRCSVNPSSARRPDAKLLPGSSRRSTPRRIDFRVERTERARARRRGGLRGGRGRRDPGGDERRRPDRRRSAAPWPAPRRRSGIDPRRPRQRPRPRARHPRRARGGGRGRSLAGHSRQIDVGEANGQRFLCIASGGFDSDANRIANETDLAARQPRLRLRGAARPARAGSRPVHARASTASGTGSPATRSRSPTAGVRRRHVHRARRGARRRPVRRRHGRRGRQAPLPG